MWRFPLRLESALPNADDTIVVQAGRLNKPSSVRFALNSTRDVAETFEAYLLDDVCQVIGAGSQLTEFALSPTRGILPAGLAPLDADDDDEADRLAAAAANPPGVPFTLTFAPTQYGRHHRCNLLVTTPTQQWLYSIRGLVGDAPAGQARAKKHSQSQRAQLSEPDEETGETATGADATAGIGEAPASALPAAAQSNGSPTRKLNYLQRNILAVKQAPRGHRVMPAEIKLIV
jgi:hypothetical protein